MVMKRSSRGSITRAFSRARRFREDEDYRKKQKLSKKKWYQKNKEREKIKKREYYRKLNEFANKRCKVCNKLLNYRTKSRFCAKHIKKRGRWNKMIIKSVKELS